MYSEQRGDMNLLRTARGHISKSSLALSNVLRRGQKCIRISNVNGGAEAEAQLELAVVSLTKRTSEG